MRDDEGYNLELGMIHNDLPLSEQMRSYLL